MITLIVQGNTFNENSTCTLVTTASPTLYRYEIVLPS
jgi:hypothetical protein